MPYANTIQSTKTIPDGVYAEGLSKSFGDVQALREVSFHAPAGSVLGLLGHNGAGKTTAVRILTTLAKPSSGQAFVAGFDPVSAPADVRAPFLPESLRNRRLIVLHAARQPTRDAAHEKFLNGGWRAL